MHGHDSGHRYDCGDLGPPVMAAAQRRASWGNRGSRRGGLNGRRFGPLSVHLQRIAPAEPAEVCGDEVLQSPQTLLVRRLGAQCQRASRGEGSRKPRHAYDIAVSQEPQAGVDVPEGTRLTVLVRAQSMCCSANEAQLASHTRTSAPSRLLSHARGSPVREGDQSDAVVGGVVGRSGRLNARTYGPLRFGDLRLGRGVSRLGATQLPAGQSSVCARRSDVCLLMSRHTSPAPSDAPSLATTLSTSAALTRIHGSHHRWSSHDSSVVGGLTSPSATPYAHRTHASERRREGRGQGALPRRIRAAAGRGASAGPPRRRPLA